MAETVTEPAVTIEKTSTPKPLLQAWQPFESLRREMDRLFHVLTGASGGLRSAVERFEGAANGSTRKWGERNVKSRALACMKFE